MSQSTFKPVGQSDNRLFGPRKVLVHGLDPRDRQRLITHLDTTREFEDLPLIFPGREDFSCTLEELFAREDQSAPHDHVLASPFVIMGGLLEHELHAFMKIYKSIELPRPIWATLTPVSATWSLTDLLTELTREHQAMGKPASS
ncbi:DUF3783 domain-containing protein [Desulfoplanes formicivorans]|uniref:DUF3783 domain-containing protein n=1 Tax=Desulfoplanes formicivorans TaxID=1592317 RepID=A0A194ACH2_9BACT|nr:DUF3783 domain-containing protein [Desulfoplanes formicivorans]GAU07832.1 hypothetical protein DPF_0531 [Desulfoplanes formicivorans]